MSAIKYKFKFLNDLTSDVMFEAYGQDLKEVFENAAEALFNVICQIDKIEPKQEIEITVNGRNSEDLMFNWLQELILIVDTENMFFSKFEIKEIKEDGTYLKAVCYGEPASPEKGGTLVKAVTYYKFKLEKTKGGYKVRVALDI